MIALRLLVLVAAFALVTVTIGWWGVAGVGFFLGWVGRHAVRRPVLVSAAAGAAAWALLLARTAQAGAMAALLARLQGLLGIPGWGLIVLTVVLGSLLSALGAWAGAAARGPGVATGSSPDVP